MSESTALFAFVIMTIAVLGIITWLSVASVRQNIDRMEEIVGDYPYTGGCNDE